MVSFSSVCMHIRVAHKIVHFAIDSISSLRGPISFNFCPGNYLLIASNASALKAIDLVIS